MIVYTDKHHEPFEIDEEDYEAVSHYTWRFGGIRGYPKTQIGTAKYGIKGNRRTVDLHIFLRGSAPPGLMWDHIDRDRRNNKRSNLRAVTPTMNNLNAAPLYKNNRSGIKGVHWNKDYRRWVAQIRVNGRQVHLGSHHTIEAAADARRSGERRLWGSEYKEPTAPSPMFPPVPA